MGQEPLNEYIKRTYGWHENLEIGNRIEIKQAFDNFYNKSEKFKKFLQGYDRRQVKNLTWQIIRKDDKDWQQGWNADVLIKFSTGEAISLDEKTRHYKYLNVELYPIEIKVGEKVGWGYKTDKYIIFGTRNEGDKGLADEPIIFKVSERFKKEISIEGKFRIASVESTDEETGSGWLTINKLVERSILERYLYG